MGKKLGQEFERICKYAFIQNVRRQFRGVSSRTKIECAKFAYFTSLHLKDNSTFLLRNMFILMKIIMCYR